MTMYALPWAKTEVFEPNHYSIENMQRFGHPLLYSTCPVAETISVLKNDSSIRDCIN